MNEVNNNSKIYDVIDTELIEQSQLLTSLDERHVEQEKILKNVEEAIVKEHHYEEAMQIEEKNDELETISLEGIKVWGQSQERLEAKALSQLNLLLGVKKENELEDGELLKEQSDLQGKEEKGICTLDIYKYIERQQQLKEKRESQKRIVAQAEKEQNIKRRELIEKKNKKTEKNKTKEEKKNRNSDSEYVPSEEDEEIEQEKGEKRRNERCIKLKDDSVEADYKTRLEAWPGEGNEEEEELSSGGAKVPGSIWSKLYEYQQEGVRWLWDLHRSKKGGLLADEMGLGKTIQVIALLAALQRLGERAGPSLVVCPATVARQWLVQFHNWWPPIRIRLLHRSGGGDSLDTLRRLVKGDFARDGADVLVVTYEGALRLGAKLERISWNYLILDEGHKIRNPFAKITIALKKLKAQYRLILTGTPMQNGLQELWSLLDFASPGTLGSLDAFLEHVATPVTRGGIEGASQSEQATAELLAISLRDLLRPHLLRRTKKALKKTLGLPSKNEQVLFCALTPEQADLYQNYLASEPIASILGRSSGGWRRADVLVAINELRKISNHPDLYLQEGNSDPSRGGKTKVVSALLRLWRRQGHRALVFTQTRAALDILEETARRGGYKYLRMDGTTSVSRRQSLVDTFNSEEIYDVFLLTTRVGGLGINLTGADRVIICDPDWNPATDTQARERAWRIGQRKDVTIYRLVAAGTVEEKMFQRQVWKQLLCNQVLVDPRTQLCLKKNSLKELFSLQLNDQSETVKMYEQSQPEIIQKKKRKVTFSEDKLKDMRKMAREISRKIEQEQEEARPSPADLLAANRKKLLPVEEPLGNKIDDHDTGTSFHEALETARKFGEDYRRKRKKRHQEDPGSEVDISGTLEGEKIEGLIKREVNIIKKKEQNEDNVAVDQDDYVLQKLFNKTGLKGALKHDDIIKEGSSQDGNSLKIHCESTRRAQKALDALRRSRLDNWRY